jgi:D-aminopeptidase
MMQSLFFRIALFMTFVVGVLGSELVGAQVKPRARDLGVPFDGTPGPLNAITDVKGIQVGHTTLI